VKAEEKLNFFFELSREFIRDPSGSFLRKLSDQLSRSIWIKRVEERNNLVVVQTDEYLALERRRCDLKYTGLIDYRDITKYIDAPTRATELTDEFVARRRG
jgi:hypothetical protein